MFDIIIPAFNKLDLTKKCIESVRENTPLGEYRIWLINDASTDDTFKWGLHQQQDNHDITVLNNSINSGYVKSVNRGVAESMMKGVGGFIFVLNNDVVLQKPWISGALELFHNKKVAIIGAYGIKELAEKKRHFISGSRLIIRKSVVDTLGMYDENIEFGYWEDVDLSWRIQREGWEIRKYSYFEKYSSHDIGSSFKQNKRKNLYYNNNKRYLEDKIRRWDAKH